MATRKQTAAAKRNIKKARTAAERQRIDRASSRLRFGRIWAGRPLALGHEAANPVAGWKTGTRQQLYDEAKRRASLVVRGWEVGPRRGIAEDQVRHIERHEPPSEDPRLPPPRGVATG